MATNSLIDHSDLAPVDFGLGVCMCMCGCVCAGGRAGGPASMSHLVVSKQNDLKMLSRHGGLLDKS